MKQSVKFPNPYYRILAAALGFYVVALVGSAAHADANRQGFYAGVELGFANPADMDSTVSGVNHPTQCDQRLDSDENVVSLDNPICDVGGPRPLLQNTFDLGTGFLGGVSVGYMLDELRVEFEYLNRSHGGDFRPIRVSGGNAVLQDKNSEWSTIDPPSERVANFSAHQFFINAYYDFLNATRWTPYAGVGVGWSRTSLHYANRFVRRTISQEYPVDQPPAGPSPDDLPPAAAGTVSLFETDITQTLFGFQLLGGLDYALTEAVSIGVKGRWAHFQDINDDDVWDLIRSHAPVRADGMTPFSSKQTFGNIEYWALSFGLKYHF